MSRVSKAAGLPAIAKPVLPPAPPPDPSLVPSLPPTIGAALSEAALDFALGLPTAVCVPVIYPNGKTAPPPHGPYLFPDVTRRGRVWTIHDRPTALEKTLDIERPFARHETGFGIEDVREAQLYFLNWLHKRRNDLLGIVMPTQVDLSAVLAHFIRHNDAQFLMGELTRKSYRSYLTYLKPIVLFWSSMKAGQISPLSSAMYAKWRMEQRIATQKPDAANPRFVTRNTVRHELTALNTALGVYGEAHGIVLPRATIPRLEKNAVAWLSRREVARLLWTCRGRVWNAQANRWKIRADDDPSLAGTPEGSLRVIDERFARGPGKAMGRLIRLGVYSGSRHFVLIGANFFDEETLAHFDLGSGVLHRRGTRVAETTKRSPEILMPVKLCRWTENWSREAQETGIARVVHKSDGTPYASISTYLWRRLCAAAGIDKRVTTHVLRHTCAMWLKLEGIPLDQAADYLGMTPKVLQQSYGKWDLRSTARPSAALNGCAGMKAAEAAMRRRGLL